MDSMGQHRVIGSSGDRVQEVRVARRLEICVDSIDSALAAGRGGAHRIEMCSSLLEGGLTPSAGTIRAVREHVSLAVFVMIRPRGGDFLYSDAEFAAMKEDIRTAKSLGANGVVLGLLTEDGHVDVPRTRELIELARPMETTFHRAFDLSEDVDRSLEDVIATGATRILTSGGAPTAPVGLDRIRRLVDAARERIVVMAGSGIKSGNLQQVLAATGVNEVHASAKTPVASAMQYRRNVAMGSGPQDEYVRQVTDEEEVRALGKILSE
jgi:copper homeostasis protein